MKRIVHITSSPRGEASFSIRLGNAITDKLRAAYPGSTVTERNLLHDAIPHIDGSHLAAFFTPEDQHSDDLKAAAAYSDEIIAEIIAADHIVIGAPLYNFSVHSSLKAWLDHLARAGKTFRYSENGAEGLVTGKKVYIAMASGGVYTEGPMQDYDFVAPYLEKMLGFLGMTDVMIVRAEGTSMPHLSETALEKAVDSVKIDAETIAG